MAVLQILNLAARFALELCALGLVSYVAHQMLRSSGWATVGAVAAPLVLVLAWATFASPKAAIVVADPWKVWVQMLLLFVPAAGLARMGKPGWAGAYGSAVMANAVLMAWWEQ